MLARPLAAELIGTFWLVFGGRFRSSHVLPSVVAPVVGAVLGALAYGWVARATPSERVEPGLRPAPVGPVDTH
jgi:glycerol uptake facilitator-like aquaporin